MSGQPQPDRASSLPVDGVYSLKGGRLTQIARRLRAVARKPTNQVSLGRPTAVKTFTRNNNNKIQSRISRQATTKRISTQLSCVANSKQPRSFFPASVKRSLFPLPKFNPVLCFLPVLVLASLAFTAVPALAAAPESPGPVTVEWKATEATFYGVLNPAKAGEEGTYEFLYKASGTECAGGSKSTRGLSFGFEHEELPAQVVTGLSPHTEYTVCLLARNLAGEETVGPAAHFTTALPPEAPETKPATGPTATEATLHGVLDPNYAGEPGSYQFAYRASASECEGESATSPQSSAGNTPEPVSMTVGGLLPHTTYTFCVVAYNGVGEQVVGPGVSFTTSVAPPAVAEESFSRVGSIGADVTAQVNMQGSEGDYYYLYGTKSEFEAKEAKKTQEAGLAANGSPVAAPAQLTGMQPATEYYFRIVVTNVNGEIELGDMLSFKTLPEGIQGLPDERVYEMVTPTENHDADVYVPDALYSGESLSEGIPTGLPFQVSPDGTAITYVADATTHGFGEIGKGLGNQYLARRATGGGWVQSVIQPQARRVTYFQGFSSDLSMGILVSGGEAEPRLPTLSAQSANSAYSDLYECVESKGGCTTPEQEQEGLGSNPYQPFFQTPPNRTTTEFGTSDNNGKEEGVFNSGKKLPVAVFAGGSAGFGSVLFEANDALLGGTGAFESELEADVRREVAEKQDHNYLYDSVGGRLSLVDVSPGGKVVSGATFGGRPFSQPGANPPAFSGVISPDGGRVYWSDGSGRIYVRENPSQPQSPIENGTCTVPAEACTVAVSEGAAQYWASAAEGRYAFYTEGGALYRFDIEGAPGQQREALTSSQAGVLGLLGVSEDGEDVYAVAEGILSSGASGEGSEPVEGQPNLYLLRHGSKPVFIATLSSEDGNSVEPFMSSLTVGKGEFGDWQPGFGKRTARVTGGGGAVVFMSKSPLPVVGFPRGYSDDGLDEVYVFEAGVGRLFCVSCSSSGEAPPASESAAAAFLPVSDSDTYLPQWVSEDGDRVFFDSAVPLVPQDTNGKQDAYEWEEEGAGSCTAQVAVNGGCVFLLSGGTSSTDSWFVGASAGGGDAFVVTRAQLVAEDQSDTFNLFDARVGGVKPVAPAACTGTGCQGVPAPPPTFATPPSGTYEGVGNFPAVVAPKAVAKGKAKPLTRAQKLAAALKVCKKQKQRKKRAACEARAKKRFGSKRAEKSAKGRK